MTTYEDQLLALQSRKENAPLHITTLGGFSVIENGRAIRPKDWGRDKTIQLFQFLITNRSRRSLHKNQIIDRLWEDEADERDFKVALHGINKALEPSRPPRSEPKYVIRQGSTYQLNWDMIWVDVHAIESFIKLAHQTSKDYIEVAKKAYYAALYLHSGPYLPNRTYDDWSSEERERIQVLLLTAYQSLGSLMLSDNPAETIRLTQEAIIMDNTWEDSYLLQMKAYLAKGNRPAAIKTYHACIKILDEEFGLDPLPETQAVYDSIV